MNRYPQTGASCVPFPSQPATGGVQTPGLIDQIEVAHTRLALLYEVVAALSERLTPVLEPERKLVEPRPDAPPAGVTYDPAPVVIEMSRLHDRIDSLNGQIQDLTRRLAL